jgi:glycosyltransferase involved in cell wall biosynthesis
MRKLEGGLRTKGLRRRSGNLQDIKKTNLLFKSIGYIDGRDEYPLISIITVVYNGEKYLEHTIQSVLGQTYPNIEYIIMDGGSTDNSVSIIEQYADKIDYFVSENDNGIYHAMNKGIRLSKGELIGIINCDDWYDESAVENVVKIYLELEDRDNAIISGGLRHIDVVNNNDVEVIRKKSDLANYIKKTMPINHPATFVSAQVYKTIGMFNEKFVISGDYNFVCEAYYSSLIKFYFCETVLTNMRLGGLSTENRNIFLIAKEHYLVRKEHMSIIENIYYMSRFLLISLVRAALGKIKEYRD